jgi:hypothetical protein
MESYGIAQWLKAIDTLFNDNRPSTPEIKSWGLRSELYLCLYFSHCSADCCIQKRFSERC